MTSASRHIRPVVSSLGPPTAALHAGRPVAALGRFWYPRPPLWPTAISAAIHVVIGSALIWTASKAIQRSVAAVEAASFMPPPQRQLAATRGGDASELLPMLSLSHFTGSGTGDGAAGNPGHAARRSGGLTDSRKDRGTHNNSDTTNTLGDNVYSSFEVDNAVQISYGSAVPQYPPDLLARHVQGTVVVRFVVDTTGSADIESIQILDSSDPQFAESVREALPHMRFSPARLNGHRVRQLVEQPFRFNVALPTSSPIDSGAR